MIENVIFLLLGAGLVYLSFMSRNRIIREETVHHHKDTYISTSTEQESVKKSKDSEDEEGLNTFFN